MFYKHHPEAERKGQRYALMYLNDEHVIQTELKILHETVNKVLVTKPDGASDCAIKILQKFSH